MAAAELVQVETSGGVATVRLNNPDRLNAMDVALGDALLTAMHELGQDPAVRVIVLTGNGRAFSAGGDLKMLETNSRLPPHEIAPKMRAFYGRYLSLRDIPKPILAAINGYAIGAGMCVALACDLRIAAADAPMAVNFAQLGLSPGMGATYLLPRAVGAAQALDLLWSGRRVHGEEALRLGLVERVVAPAELDAAAAEWAAELAAGAPIAMRLIKESVYAGQDGRLEDALKREAAGQAQTFGSDDLRAGLTALKDRATPTFNGR